jgi:hypothetical protein
MRAAVAGWPAQKIEQALPVVLRCQEVRIWTINQ